MVGIVVVTKGEFSSWDDIRIRLLPLSLRVLNESRIWIDIRQRRPAIESGPLDAALRGLMVEDLSQLLLRLHPHRSWEELQGEERPRRLTALRLFSATVALLAILAGVATAAAVVARRQQLVAESRMLAAQALEARGRDATEGLNLAIRGWKRRRTDESHLAVARIFPTLVQTVRPNPSARRASEPLSDVHFLLDDERILTIGRGSGTMIWNGMTGSREFALEAQTGDLEHSVPSADASQLLVVTTHSAALWSLPRNREIARLPSVEGLAYGAFGPTATEILLTGDNGMAALWTPMSRRVIRLVGHASDKTVGMGAFSPDGTTVATASDDGTVRLWNGTTGSADRELIAHPGHAAYHVEFSHDGRRILTTSDDHTARVWDSTNGRLLRTLPHSATVWEGHFSLDDRQIVTASDDATARVWDAAGASVYTFTHPPPPGRSDPPVVHRASFSPDGRWIATASSDGIARIWEIATGQVVAYIDHADDVVQAEFSRSGDRLVTASRDGEAKIWHLIAGQAVTTGTGHRQTIRSAYLSPDEKRVVTASDDKTARIWDAASGALVRTLVHDHALRRAVISPDGTVVTGPFASAEFSRDGKRVLLANVNATAQVFGSPGGGLIATLPGHAEGVSGAVFFRDGQRVLTVNADAEGTTTIYRILTLRDLAEIMVPPKSITDTLMSLMPVPRMQ